MYNIKILSREDIMQISDMSCVIDGVKAVYIAKSNDEAVVWPTVFYEWQRGLEDIDIKSGYLKNLKLFGHKTVSYFGGNKQLGLPTLNGVICIYDATTGVPLGILDASYITGIRTGAAGAIGAKYLARQDAKNLLIVGAGNQASNQIAATLTLFNEIEKVMVIDMLDHDNAVNFVNNIEERLDHEYHIKHEKVEFVAVNNIEEAVKNADIIITVTPSRSPIIKREWVKPGTHFSCIGSDMQGKEEIDPQIIKDARVYVDDMMHCVEVGEIEIPLKMGLIDKSHIIGEIGDLILNKIEGRKSDEDITVFDATGMALLDIATAKTILDLANEKALGTNANI